MTDVVVAHGAWSAGWAWKKMRPLLRAAGHEMWTPTYTGLGERAHLAIPSIDLDTHIADMTGVLEIEDLRDVALIGHSYGGMVATGVADRARVRVSQVIYVDAFVPKDGQSLVDLVGEEAAAICAMVRETRARAGAFRRCRCRPTHRRKTSDGPRRCAGPQPIETFETRLRLTGQGATLPRSLHLL